MRNPGKFPLWQDLLIILSLVALGVIGVLALWGDRMRGWLDGDRPEASDGPAEAPAAGPPPAIPGGTL